MGTGEPSRWEAGQAQQISRLEAGYTGDRLRVNEGAEVLGHRGAKELG
jgi:hypothetical protein